MSDSPASMVDRVVLILSVFERSSGTLTLGQISSRTKLPRSSVHRILQQLVNARWLQRNDSEYTLGLRMFEIGSRVVQRTRITDVARPFMQELCAATGLVVHLALLDEQDVVYLDKVGGTFASSLPSRIGGRMPAHCTAVGKVLLAHSPRAVIDHYVESGLRRQTSASIMAPDTLEAAVLHIRNVGYSTESGEALRGVGCVGAPVLEFGDAIAAISVCGPQQRLNVNELKHRAMWTAAEISRRLMATATPPPVAPMFHSANTSRPRSGHDRHEAVAAGHMHQTTATGIHRRRDHSAAIPEPAQVAYAPS